MKKKFILVICFLCFVEIWAVRIPISTSCGERITLDTDASTIAQLIEEIKDINESICGVRPKAVILYYHHN